MQLRNDPAVLRNPRTRFAGRRDGGFVFPLIGFVPRDRDPQCVVSPHVGRSRSRWDSRSGSMGQKRKGRGRGRGRGADPRAPSSASRAPPREGPAAIAHAAPGSDAGLAKVIVPFSDLHIVLSYVEPRLPEFLVATQANAVEAHLRFCLGCRLHLHPFSKNACWRCCWSTTPCRTSPSKLWGQK